MNRSARRYRAEPKSALAVARINAHRSLDCLWQFGAMTRSEAYEWLARQMSMPSEACHIGMFDEDQCRRAIEICDGRGLSATMGANAQDGRQN